MIPIFSMSPAELLETYKTHKVVLWGAGEMGKKFYELLNYFDIEVYAFCDNNEALWGPGGVL